jgi:hypothetical protein
VCVAYELLKRPIITKRDMNVTQLDAIHGSNVLVLNTQ